MSKSRDTFTHFIYLLIIGVLIYAWASTLVADTVLPSQGCDNVSGTSVSAYGLGYTSAGDQDNDCNFLEHARMDPQSARAELMRCSTGSSIKAFGGGIGAIDRCIAYNGDSKAITAMVQDQLTVCKKRAKKLRYKLSLRSRKKYNRCMSEL